MMGLKTVPLCLFGILLDISEVKTCSSTGLYLLTNGCCINHIEKYKSPLTNLSSVGASFWIPFVVVRTLSGGTHLSDPLRVTSRCTEPKPHSNFCHISCVLSFSSCERSITHLETNKKIYNSSRGPP